MTRENARVAAKAVSGCAESAEAVIELVRRTGMTRHQADLTVAVLQKAFRKHVRHRDTAHQPIAQQPLLERLSQKCGVSEQQALNAITVIQRAYRRFRLRREQAARGYSPGIDWRTAYLRTMHTYRAARNVTHEELARAATTIKAAYRGYYTRRVLRRLLRNEGAVPEPHERGYPAEGDELELAVHRPLHWNLLQGTEVVEKHAAASLIQRAYRRYSQRQSVPDQLITQRPDSSHSRHSGLDGQYLSRERSTEEQPPPHPQMLELVYGSRDEPPEQRPPDGSLASEFPPLAHPL